MDGARFANAVAGLGVSPADVTWRAGVDVLCFGGTKMGLPVGEAVVFFDRRLSEDFAYRCKQAGQLASKMRFLSAPWLGILEDGAWLRHAAHANAMARRLAGRPGGRYRLPTLFPVQANGVFVHLPSRVEAGPARARLAVLQLHRLPAARVSCAAGTRAGDRRSPARRHPRPGAGVRMSAWRFCPCFAPPNSTTRDFGGLLRRLSAGPLRFRALGQSGAGAGGAGRV
jgi:hypothetical protein